MPNLSMADGTPTGGVYGFAALSLELIKRLKPDYVCVAWDKPKTNIRSRLKIYPEYKAGRKPAPPDFYAQIPVLHELLEAFSWPLYELDDYEADDIMATLAKKAELVGGIETYLITSDLDALQILDKHTYLYALKKGLSNIEKFDVAAFEAKYGIKIDQFLDLKSLKGDSSDNIPGVAGVGEKTAVSLLQQFGTLDGVYENLWQTKDSLRRKLEAGKDSAYMSRQLGRLYFDAPVELDLSAMDVKDLDVERLNQILKKLEFKSLLRSLPEHMRLPNGSSNQAYIQTKEISQSQAIKTLKSADRLVVYWDDEKFWLSPEPGKVAKMSSELAIDILGSSKIIAHDTKLICRQLLTAGSKSLPEIAHDISQGSFLLNPLRKSRSLADLIGEEKIDDPKHAISAIWALYDEHQKAFEEADKQKIADIAHQIDFPLIPILASMEHHGMKIDVDFLDKMRAELAADIAQIEQKIYQLVGYEFNVASPAQLSEALYTKLQLPTTGIKRGKTGYSTGQKELDKLRAQHPIIELIEQYRELSKLQNTYVESLPKLVDDDCYLHTTFNQNVTSTGRLSSTDPNLQNIPVRTEQGKRIREAFVPGPGNLFVSADYSQFELRLVAVLSDDQKMIQDFNAGADIHAQTAADIYGVPVDQVTKAQRRDAKVVNFGVLYGMGPHALASNTGMSFYQAKQFIDDYFQLRHKVKDYLDQTLKQAHEDGFVETFYGRRRPTPDVNSKNRIVRASAERAAANMPIQGTEADLMKKAMIEVEKKLRIDPDKPAHPGPQSSQPLGVQILQIHDSILVECPKKNAQKVSQILVETMESIAPELPIKLKVDVSTGQNWRQV